MNIHRRFKELRDNAQNKLSGKGNDRERLLKAIIELDYLSEHEIPEYNIVEVISIVNTCKTKKALGEEGTFKATIDSMSDIEIKDLIKRINAL